MITSIRAGGICGGGGGGEGGKSCGGGDGFESIFNAECRGRNNLFFCNRVALVNRLAVTVLRRTLFRKPPLGPGWAPGLVYRHQMMPGSPGDAHKLSLMPRRGRR